MYVERVDASELKCANTLLARVAPQREVIHLRKTRTTAGLRAAAAVEAEAAFGFVPKKKSIGFEAGGRLGRKSE